MIKRRFTSVLVVSGLSPASVWVWKELTGIRVSSMGLCPTLMGHGATPPPFMVPKCRPIDRHPPPRLIGVEVGGAAARHAAAAAAHHGEVWGWDVGLPHSTASVGFGGFYRFLWGLGGAWGFYGSLWALWGLVGSGGFYGALWGCVGF